ncbi:MAG: hypothetical protein EAZ54_14410 [Curvibacter sp.]|nr:MAG: hypothetical protein EAZ54_14410 [Curvibacter sp.]
MTDQTLAPRPAPSLLLRGLILAGLLWSLFGVVQFARQTFTDTAGLVAGGMTPPQAELYAALPVWMSIAFAIGTIGGTIGCLLLLVSRRIAVAVLGVSLAAYVALYLGDIVHGVFAAFGAPQIVVLSLVVLVATGLLWLARRMQARGLLG